MISVVFMFILFTLISLFIPSRIIIPKSIDIYASRPTVLNEINNPEKWKNWYPGADTLPVIYVLAQPKGLVLEEPNKQIILVDQVTDSSVSATLSGKGNKKIKTYWNADSTSPGSTKLYWYMEFRSRWYPWEKIASLMYEKVHGTRMEKGLLKLKEMAETSARQ